MMIHMHNVNGDDKELSNYPMALMSGSIPDHTIRGLLDVGLDLVRGTGRWGQSDRVDD